MKFSLKSNLAAILLWQLAVSTNGSVVNLRILPLGDSITYGSGSSDKNGYRLDLEKSLISAGYTVQYIGSLLSGSMPDNYNEGHSGAVITQIATFANLTLKQLPNVVLVMAGTNDMNNPIDPATAPTRLGALIDQIVAAVPEAVVLIASLIPSKIVATEVSIVTFNAAVPGIVATRAKANKKVLAVDMSKILAASDLADALHPNDQGYVKMASAWFDGITQASSNGWVSAPQDVTATSGSGAGACSGLVKWISHGLVATGAAIGDAAFKSGWTSFGKVAAGGVGKGTSQGSGVHLADINGDGLADYLWVDPTTGAVIAYLNGGIKSDGTSVWKSIGSIATGVGVGAGVSFADIDGDGCADYLWTSASGDVSVLINGNGTDSSGTWKWSSQGVIAKGLGGSRDTIRFADIDGDGRADYLYVGAKGNLTAFLNYGSGGIPAWKSMGEIATGLGYSDAAGVQLADINGDGRADYLWISTTGAVTAYLNEPGTQGKLWPNWTSAGVIATGVGAARGVIQFADLTGDEKADYVVVAADTGALNVWVNTGSGGSFEAGAEVFFADIDGDGKDDYLALDTAGKTTAWFNGGTASDGTITWKSQGVIATGVGKPRSTIHFADLNGDGFEDYLTLDPTTGAVAMWQNGGSFDSSGTWKWTSLGIVATGVGAGAGVVFADMDGDGKDDYVWIDSNGAASLWINEGKAGDSGWVWTSKGKIATGVGASREDIFLADIDGDGKADYLWVDRLTGETKMWKNGGVGSDGNWIWTSQGEIATGVGTNGKIVKFADLGGTGRSDYLNVISFSSGVTRWENGCDGVVGSGDGSSSTVTSLPTATTAVSSQATGISSTSSATPTGTGTAKSGCEGRGDIKVGALCLILVVMFLEAMALV